MGRPRKKKQRTDSHTPAALAAWAEYTAAGNGPGRTAELTLVVSERGSAWTCRLWNGEYCHGVGRAGVDEADARDLAVRRAAEAAVKHAVARGWAKGVS